MKATLRSKLQAIAAETPDEVDVISRPLVFDDDAEDSADAPDVTAGADLADELHCQAVEGPHQHVGHRLNHTLDELHSLFQREPG